MTGSTGGLGRAVAEALFLSGVTVIVNGRDDNRTQKAVDDIYVKLERSSGLLAVGGDMSKPEDAQKIVDATIAKFGKLDIIVNNAGINIDEAPFEQQSAEDWAKMSSVNLGGPLNLIRCALPYLRASKQGRIINLSSIGGHVGLPHNSLYTMTKGGVRVFTKSLAAELATTSVTCNSISPGVFQTPMNVKFEDAEAQKEVVKSIPMGRMGTPTELVGAVLYLASDCASYTTGTDILVDGGYTSV